MKMLQDEHTQEVLKAKQENRHARTQLGTMSAKITDIIVKAQARLSEKRAKKGEQSDSSDDEIASRLPSVSNVSQQVASDGQRALDEGSH